jgi:hypothetical protein
MKFFNTHLPNFLDPTVLEGRIVLPSYLSKNKKINLINFLLCGFGRSDILEINWKKEKLRAESFLSKRNNDYILIIDAFDEAQIIEI